VYCRVLGIDFDGTGATSGELAPEVADALRAARAAGYTTLLATGRVLEELRVGGLDFSVFDAVVAENGAVVWLPSPDRTIFLGAPPPGHFLSRLRTAGVPFHVGSVVIGTWERYAEQALALVRETGAELQIVFNRGAVMLLPTGLNKATGVRRALDELGRSARNLIAFGDAENDLPLFSLAEVAVAARGAMPAVAAMADDQLSRPGADGVAHYISTLLAAGGVVTTPPRRQIVLGETPDGQPAALPASGGNVLVVGDPRSGKSWLAGLVAERLIEEGYRLCVLDPEGDYPALAQRPGVLLLGRSIALPAADVLPEVLHASRGSLIVDLAGLPQRQRCAYVCKAVAALARERPASGLPHWILVDEAQYCFREGEPCCEAIDLRSGNFVFVTYRPSSLAAAVHASVDTHVITHTELEEERYFLNSLLRERGPTGAIPGDIIAELRMPRAGLLVQTQDGPRWQTFLPTQRVSPSAHHAHKYADTRLPEDKAFWFRISGDGVANIAHSVREFYDAVNRVPIATLHRHLLAGDFSRWVRDVLGDPDFAAGLAKLEYTTSSTGIPPSRDEILAHVRDRYVV